MQHVHVPDALADIAGPIVERILREIPRILVIYAYGSRPRGEEHPGSDLDLALLLPRGTDVSPDLLAQLEGDFEALAGFPVELSILSLETQVVHCKEVIGCGTPLYVADRRALDEFEMHALSYYARLCEDRKAVLQAYAGEKRG